MGQKPTTTVKDAQEKNPAKKYTSIVSFVKDNWQYRRVNKPFFDYELDAYAIVVQSSRFISENIFMPNGEIDQDNFRDQISFAQRRMLAYYNKIVDDINIDRLDPVTVLREIEIRTAPDAENLYYVTVDAATFDAIPDKGNYILTPMTKRTSINQISEEYRDYFRVTDRTSRGQRARIAEILRTNDVNILTSTKADVEEWIYRVNYGYSTPPGKDAKFNEGSEIYLPRTEPDFTKVVLGGQEIELTIGEISDNIEKLILMMEKYKVQIQGSEFVVRTLNMDKQIELLREFYPKLTDHFRNNEYRINSLLEGKVRIGIDKNFVLVYVGLTMDGSTAYLNKALPGLAVESPFDDPRVMNFLAKLREIILQNADVLTWQDFVRTYVFPEAIIESRTASDLLPDLQKGSKSILEQLADRFNKFPIKSDRIIAEENSILSTPKIMAAIAAQQTKTARDAGDAVVQNLAHIYTRISNPSDTACGAAATIYNSLLNKIDYKSLAASALDCLMDRVPFDCKDIIVAVAEVGCMDSTSIFPGVSGLAGINDAFKSRMRPAHHPLAEEAFHVAGGPGETDCTPFGAAAAPDFTLYEIKYGYPYYLVLEENYADKKRGEIYLAALEKVLVDNGVDYNSIFQEVCGLFSNPFQLLPNVFSIPTMFFPDNLPTVNIDAGYIASLESFFLDAISAMIVQMVQGLLNQLLAWCVENAQLLDGESENGNTPNVSNLSAAIAHSVGDENFDDTIAGLLEDLVDFTSTVEETREFLGEIKVGEETVSVDTITTPGADVEITTAVQAMKDFFDVLQVEMQDSMRIISLLQGLAPDIFAQEALDIVQRDGGRFTYGVDSERNLTDIIRNLIDVREMFAKIGEFVTIKPIIEELDVIAGKVGCEDLNEFISQRVPLWCGKVDPDLIPTVAEDVVVTSKDIMEDLWRVILEEIPTPQSDCDDPAGPSKGSISRDPFSFSYLIDKVVKDLFDPVYMAYDSSVLLLPEPYFVDATEKRVVKRTIRADSEISIRFYNFSKLQEEDVKFPGLENNDSIEALRSLAEKLGVTIPGTPRMEVMNPEFKRLLATGFVPSDGVVDGVYGPYTTAVPKDAVGTIFGGLSPQGLTLDPIEYAEKTSIFALNSSNAFREIDQSLVFFHGELGDTGAPTITAVLQEPINISNKLITAQTIMKIDLLADNRWQISIGKALPDLGPSRFLGAIGTAPANSEFMISSNKEDAENAFYDLVYAGENVFPAAAQEVLDYVETRTPLVEDEVPQIILLTRFMQNIFGNGLRHAQNIGGLTPSEKEDVGVFAKDNMFPSIIKQMSFGIAKQCLESPMFRFTDDNNAPYMSLVDWAPLPSEEEAECGYDPHILSLETMMRRIIEDYENEITCTDPSKEISIDGKGKDELSSLEKASMAGLIMTTLRAYALEQLMRSIFPVSAFPCQSFLKPIQIKFIVDKVIENLSEKSSSYFEAFLEQLEKVFAGRMKEFSAFGVIRDITDPETGKITKGVISLAEDRGIDWVYAKCALEEYHANTVFEPPHVTLPSGEVVLASQITSKEIQEQLSSLPTPDFPPGVPTSVSDLFNAAKQGPPDLGSGFGSSGVGGEVFDGEDSDLPGSFSESSGTPDVGPPPATIKKGVPNNSGIFEIVDGLSYDTISGDPPPVVKEGVPTTSDLFVLDPSTAGTVLCEPINSPSTIPTTPLIELLKCRFGFLVEEQLYSVLEKLQDLVSLNGQFSFEERFLAKNMPFVDVRKDQRFVDDSRFFGSNSKDLITAANAEVLAKYPLYLEKYNEWHTANGNWIIACQAFAIASAPTLVGLIAGAFFQSMALVLATGTVPIPVPKYIFNEELADNSDADIFYIGKHTTVGNLGGDRIYKYTNVNIDQVISAFATNLTSIFDNIGSRLEELLDLNEDPTLGPNVTTFLPEGVNISFGVYSPAHVDAVDAVAESSPGAGDATAGSAEKFKGEPIVWTEEDFIEFFKSSPNNMDADAAEAAAGVYLNADAGDSNVPAQRPVRVGDILQYVVNPASSFLAATLTALANAGAAIAGNFGVDVDATDFGHVNVPPVVLWVNTAAFFSAFTTEDDSSHLVPFPWLEDFIDTTIDPESVVPLDNENEPLLLLNPNPKQGEEVSGQVIMERYIKTKGRLPGDSLSLAGSPSSDNFEGERFSEDPLSGLTGESSGDLTDLSLTQVLSPRETINTSNRGCGDIGFTSQTNQGDVTISIGGQINIDDEQIWNISDFEKYLGGLSSDDDDADKIFDKVSFGIRLVYVAAPPSLVDILEVPQGEEWAAANVTENESHTAAENAGHKKLVDGGFNFDYDPEVIKRSKSYLEYENYSLHGELDFIDHSGIDESGTGFQPIPSVSQAGGADIGLFIDSDTANKERFLQLFPLMSVETSIGVDGISRNEILNNLNIGAENKGISWAHGYGPEDMKNLLMDKYFDSLTLALKNSSIYKYMFNYCIPGETLLSFVSIYANLINELPEEFFDKTKFELKNLFEILMNGGDYTFETSEEKKRGGNRGEFARAMANYGTEGKSRNPGLFDLAVKTPKLIFKGLAEFIDPVVKPASTIVKAGNAGKLLPQTMKVLRIDNSPGGVEDENYFVTNIILPKGTVAWPVGDIAGSYPVVIRNKESEMPIPSLPTGAPRPLDDNEIVTFRLRDRITKGSEIGNHLFDAYLQNVFFKQYNPALKTAPGAQNLYNNYYTLNGANPQIDIFQNSNSRFIAHQKFALALLNRNMLGMSRALFDAYKLDLEVVRLGIIEELILEHPEIDEFLPDFSPATFKRLREVGDDKPGLCDARDKIIAILSGQAQVERSNFTVTENGNEVAQLATGFLQFINPSTGKLELVPGDGNTIDWIIWGSVAGSFTVPNPPQPEPIFPGYPIPLPVTPIAMSFLPADMIPYSKFPPHSPLGWAYHAIVASDNMQNISLDQKALQRQNEGLENKKKIYDKLCIDMERIANEEKKRRGLE